MSLCCAKVHDTSDVDRETKKETENDIILPIVDEMIRRGIDRMLDCTRPRKYTGSYWNGNPRVEFDDASSLVYRLCSTCGKPWPLADASRRGSSRSESRVEEKVRSVRTYAQ